MRGCFDFCGVLAHFSVPTWHNITVLKSRYRLVICRLELTIVILTTFTECCGAVGSVCGVRGTERRSGRWLLLVTASLPLTPPRRRRPPTPPQPLQPPQPHQHRARGLPHAGARPDMPPLVVAVLAGHVLAARRAQRPGHVCCSGRVLPSRVRPGHVCCSGRVLPSRVRPAARGSARGARRRGAPADGFSPRAVPVPHISAGGCCLRCSTRRTRHHP